MKFKVGDRVRIVKVNADFDNYYQFIGCISTIESIDTSSAYPYNLKEYDECGWCDEELELAPFTKADLKDGMVVEYHCGDRRIVLGDKLMGFDSWVDIVAFNDNLECENNKDLNIYKVYNSDSHILKDYFKDKSLALIWERNKKEEESVKKMTVAEIEKELGYKVEIVSND